MKLVMLCKTAFLKLPFKKLKSGNRIRLSALFDKLSDQATLHGNHQVLDKIKKSWKTWLWRVIFALCVYLVISGTPQLIENVFEPLHAIGSYKLYDLGLDIDPMFPDKVRIIICKVPPWTAHVYNDLFLVKYGFAALGYPFYSLSGSEHSYVFYNTSADDIKELTHISWLWERARQKYNETRKSDPIFNERSFIEEQSPRCYGIFPDHERMCLHFKPVYTARGKCYTELYSGPNPGVLHFYSPKHEGSHEPEGYAVMATHPMAPVEFVDPNEAIILPPDSSMTLRVSLRLVNRDALYTSWYSNEPNCPLLPKMLEMDKTRRKIYNVATCQDRWILNFIEKTANCSSILRKRKEGSRLCSPDDMIDGYKNWLRNPNYQAHVKKRRRACAKPCKEYKYDLEWTMTRSGRKKVSQLIYHYDNAVFFLKEYKKSSFRNIINRIGGYLGLYLGASIIIIVELIGLLMQCIRYKGSSYQTHRNLEEPAAFQQELAQFHR